VPALEIAAALAKLSLGDRPLLMKSEKSKPSRPVRDSGPRKEGGEAHKGKRRRDRPQSPPAENQERFRIEVGHQHGVKPGNIVGAIANESGLDGDHIGHIEIHTEYSLVDLPVGIPREVFNDLIKVRVCGQALRISRPGKGASQKKEKSKPARKKKGGKKSKARIKGELKLPPKMKGGSKAKTRKKKGPPRKPRG
jgi:ATP-dependent RNA helicase DeaD